MATVPVSTFLVRDTEANILALSNAAGTEGRVGFTTDTSKVYYDTGSAWVEIKTTPGTEATQDIIGAMIAAAGGSYNDGAGTIDLGITYQFAIKEIDGTPGDSWLELEVPNGQLSDRGGGTARLDAAPTSHTHTASQVTDFAEAVDDRVAALVQEAAGIDVAYNDGANTLTIAPDIPTLTADASPVGSTDYVMTYDASASAHKKVLLDDLPGGGGGASDAVDVTYDPAASGLAATDVQAAIDEVAASGGGGGGLVALDEVTVGAGGAANIAFSAIDQGYAALVIAVDNGRTEGSAIDYLCVRYNGDAGAHYSSLRGATTLYDYSEGRMMLLAGTTITAPVGNTQRLTIPGYAATTGWKVGSGLGGDIRAHNDLAFDNWVVVWQDTAAITDILLFAAAGNDLAEGMHVVLYGVPGV